jgi:two-component system sensor histidine kinase/response regulator
MKRERNASRRFALALLDSHMPGIDGFALARAIRQDATLAGAAIMMLSSSDLHEDAKRCRESGVATYLVKPVNAVELRQAILKALGATSQPELQSVAAVLAGTEPGENNQARPLRILLTEDNAVNQKLMLHLLEKRGYLVTVAADGARAVEACKRQSFDLILMDIQMPEMGGFEATQLIRAAEALTGNHVPIVALTAHAMKGDRERCLEAGMDDYLSKPIQQKALFESVTRLTELAPLTV